MFIICESKYLLAFSIAYITTTAQTVIGVAAFAAHLIWQVAMIDPASPERALRLFRSNRDAGLLLFVAFALQGLLA